MKKSAEVRLQPFTQDEHARLISWVDTPGAMRDWSGAFFEYPLLEEQLVNYAAEAEEGKRNIFSVFKGLRHVGHAELSNKIPYHSCFLSRILVAPTERGKGYGEAMIRKLLAVAFVGDHSIS